MRKVQDTPEKSFNVTEKKTKLPFWLNEIDQRSTYITCK